MTHEDLQSLSHDIANFGSEVAFRSAVSRSYYSAFHAMREQTQDVMLSNPPMGSHALVTARIKEKYGEALSKHFHKMKKHRNSADYDTEKTFKRNHAEKMFSDRNFLLSKVVEAEALESNKGEG